MHVESRYVATLPQEEQAARLELEQARRTEHRDRPWRRGDVRAGSHRALPPRRASGRRPRRIRRQGGRRSPVGGTPVLTSEQAMFAAVAAEGLGVTDVDPAVEPDGAAWMEERSIGSWDVFTTLVTRLDGRTAVEASAPGPAGGRRSTRTRRATSASTGHSPPMTTPAADRPSSALRPGSPPVRPGSPRCPRSRAASSSSHLAIPATERSAQTPSR